MPIREARADFRIAADIAQRLGVDVEGRAASLIFQRLAEKTPQYAGLNYPALSRTHEQWPLFGRHDMYYGGTSYENRTGLGVTLPAGTAPAVEMPAEPEGRIAPAAGQVLAVPITRLYDRGVTMLPSERLQARGAKPEIWLNPATAVTLLVEENTEVHLIVNGAPYVVRVKIDESLPEGVGLVPRSTGVPVFGPLAVRIERAADPVTR
jgi:predicted molibdopterin-dependent oxidoreductase YjgC